jgi:hypothetical protein
MSHGQDAGLCVALGQSVHCPDTAGSLIQLHVVVRVDLTDVQRMRDRSAKCRQLRTNAYMAEEFINEAEFAAMSDQLNTIAPILLAR